MVAAERQKKSLTGIQPCTSLKHWRVETVIDLTRSFAFVTLSGGWLGNNYSKAVVSTVLLGTRSTPTATLLGRHSGYNRYAIPIVRNSRWWRLLGCIQAFLNHGRSPGGGFRRTFHLGSMRSRSRYGRSELWTEEDVMIFETCAGLAAARGARRWLGEVNVGGLGSREWVKFTTHVVAAISRLVCSCSCRCRFRRFRRWGSLRSMHCISVMLTRLMQEKTP